MKTLTPAYFSAVFSKLSDTLVKGTKTNYGIFSHWDANNFAIFESGWVGYEALHFIQVEREPRPLVVTNPFVMKPLVQA